MADPFYAEIRIFGFNYAPLDWAFCDGALVNVYQNQPLYALIGNIYGGTAGQTFKLPNLSLNGNTGTAAMAAGTSPLSGNTYTLGETAGSTTCTLNTFESYPTHDHTVSVSVAPSTSTNPSGLMPSVFAVASPGVYYNYTKAITKPTLVAMEPRSMQAFGSNSPTPHENRQPYLAMNFCICTNGIFPPLN